ncbi:hypothetical protein EWM64_g5158 [Hericium alpestre]|uniref:Uncharacterized protein n=1 Tax=Hericium alpestre TaxID=135208 RepID=A0A4Y9ZZI6_9AGAM|nr:hypothetical protein EWM64_g5158 [Hericium alpestre]
MGITPSSTRQCPTLGSLADGLAGATRTGAINQQLLIDIQGMVLGEGVRPQDIQAFLEQDLARLAVGAATGTPHTQQPSTNSAVVSPF